MQASDRAPAYDLNLLALDTSSEWCSAALWLDGDVRARQEHAVQRHTELILPMVDDLLQQAGVTVRQLNGIGFGAGPGPFTGLRIACGIAQGLAFGAALPVVPVGTLECLAEASGAPRVLSAMDARMGEIYFAAYLRDGSGWCAEWEPMLCDPASAPAVDGSWVGCGSGFDAHGETLRARYGVQLQSVRPDVVPHAREVAAIAARMLAAGRGVDAASAAPVYIRDKVALSVAERMARGALGRSDPR